MTTIKELTKGEKEDIHRGNEHTCQFCGNDVSSHTRLIAKPKEEATVEHLIPKYYSVINKGFNLTTTCKRCNELIGHKTFGVMEEEKLSLEEKAQKLFKLKKKYVELYLEHEGECQYCKNDLADNDEVFIPDEHNGQIKKIVNGLDNNDNYTLACKRCKEEIERNSDEIQNVKRFENTKHLITKTFLNQREYTSQFLEEDIEEEIRTWENHIHIRKIKQVQRMI